MCLTKPMVKVFTTICHGKITLSDIASETGKSISWVSEILTKLEEAGFVSEVRDIPKMGSRKSFRVRETPYAQKLKELVFFHPTMDFTEIITGTKLKILTASLFDWKDYSTIAKMLRKPLTAIRQVVPPLRNRGLIRVQGKLFRFNKKAWPRLFEFLQEWRNFSTIEGYVLWKYGNEMLFVVDKEELVKGVLTGFNEYRKFGVLVHNVTGCCYLPAKRLTKREIFVHSLHQVDDPRTLHLVLTYFLKNRLDDKKTHELATYYDCYSKYEGLKTLPGVKEEFTKLDAFGTTFDKIDFYRIATMYDVKGLKDPGKYKKQIRRGF